jgi:hypothetical protein
MSLDQFPLACPPVITGQPPGPSQIRSRRPKRLPRPRCAQMPVRERRTITIAGRPNEPVPTLWPRGHVWCTDRREWVSWSKARGGQCSGSGRPASPGRPRSPARGSPTRCGRPGKDPAACSSAAWRHRARGTRRSCSPVSWCSAGARSRSARRCARRSARTPRAAREGAALVQGADLLTVAAGPAAPQPHAAQRAR